MREAVSGWQQQEITAYVQRHVADVAKKREAALAHQPDGRPQSRATKEYNDADLRHRTAASEMHRAMLAFRHGLHLANSAISLDEWTAAIKRGGYDIATRDYAERPRLRLGEPR